MRECTLHIKRGAVHKVNVPDTGGSIVSSATVWTLYDDRQQTLKRALSEGEELVLGPFINITKFRIQLTGNAVIEEIGDDFGVPVPASDHIIFIPQSLIVSGDIFPETTDAFCKGTVTVKLIDPALATHKVTIANESSTANTVTMATDGAGAVYPTTTLTKDQAVTLSPRPPNWIQV